MVVILSGDSDARKLCMAELLARSTYYKFTVGEVSEHGVRMFDIYILHGRRWRATGLLVVIIRVKESSQGIPLGDSSAHAGFCHDSWPLGRIYNFRNICTDCDSFPETAR